MSSVAKQDADEEQTPTPEVREGVQKPTGSITGDCTDAGAMRSCDSVEAVPIERDLEKQNEIKSGDISRESSHPSSRCPSPHQPDEYTIVSFARSDPENPYNWSVRKKTYVLLTCMGLVMNSTIGSALPSGASKQTSEYFNITSQSLLVLPVSIYLIGYVLGPLVCRTSLYMSFD